MGNESVRSVHLRPWGRLTGGVDAGVEGAGGGLGWGMGG